MSPKLSCLVIIVFLINISLQWEIVKKVQDGKKTVIFFKLKSNNSIYLHQVYKSEYDYLCMSCKYDIFTSFMYVYIIFVLNHYCKYDIFTSFDIFETLITLSILKISSFCKAVLTNQTGTFDNQQKCSSKKYYNIHFKQLEYQVLSLQRRFNFSPKLHFGL